MERLLLSVLALGASGCVSCEHAVEPARLTDERTASEWPRAFAPDLPVATPATEVRVHAEGIEVDNGALVASWPADALTRARSASDAPGWPRIAQSVREGLGFEMPELRVVLERAREAERSATGAGTGASAFNLRVASDVPFERVERVLYAAAQSGYDAPRVVLAGEDAERTLPWPRASRAVPSREAIEAALRGGQALPEQPAGARVVLTNDHMTGTEGAAVVCAMEGELERHPMERCARALGESSERAVLEVASDTRFDRVTAVVQVLRTAFDELGVVRGAR